MGFLDDASRKSRAANAIYQRRCLGTFVGGHTTCKERRHQSFLFDEVSMPTVAEALVHTET